MSSILETIKLLMVVGGMIFMLFIVLLSMPQSKLRDVLMPIVGYGFALFCGFYVISPVDVLPEVVLGPFGFFDDAAAVVAGIGSAISANNASKRLWHH